MAIYLALFGASVLFVVGAVLLRCAIEILTMSPQEWAALRREDAARRRHCIVYNKKAKRFEAGRAALSQEPRP